jgi:D-alanyl-D-alanine carboxypeptidase/D-alanyl-D-alanine-endopeptidase (penicillin-binding protein 4)
MLLALFLIAADSNALAAEIDKVLKSPALNTAKVGIYVQDVSTGQAVYGKNEDVLMSPASNAKLVTTAAALSALKPDFKFTTRVMSDGAVGSDGVLQGNVYVRGAGDPALVSERVWFIANELWHMGIRRITGDVVGDDSYFDDNRVQAGWDEDTSDRAYQAMTSGLSVNFNTITLRLNPSGGEGRVGRVLFDPPTEFAKLDAAVSMGGRTKVQIDVSPLPATKGRDQVVIKGKVAAGDQGRAYWRKVDYPTEFAAHVFASFFKNAGIDLGGKVRTGVTPNNATLLLSADSPRLAEIISDLNKTSNNFVAEQILKTMGAELRGVPGTWDKGLSVVRQYMGSLGLPETSYKLQNGSGLGDVNRLTAKQLVTVLSAAARDPVYGPEYVVSLGVAGSSGTMKNRMTSGVGQYRVRAKTGSLSGACTLSGYATTLTGKTLAFSILVNGYKKMREVHDAQDLIAEALVKLGP